ncbi:hypothetical protein [Streptomyces sp. NBRC 109706]|uniref:hypothetical protein n=1 Tax=Streptomyces sp. NBRC 109706 TaxID=1550035 RepID=UPI0007848BAA|nr:hypothetical protein [Streptomyces sp. NBRC 109706]
MTTSIRPVHLPRLRDQTIRYLTTPPTADRATQSVADEHGQRDEDATQLLIKHIRHADLYVVTPDMAALAVSAGAQLAAARWATADRPSPCGLIYYQGGIGTVTVDHLDMQVEALMWGPHPDGLAIWTAFTRRALAERWAAQGRLDALTDRGIDAAPILVTSGAVLPVTTDPVPLAEADPDIATVLSALAASWLLMQQPQLVDRTREAAGPADRRRAHREGRPSPDVTVVDLRRQYTPSDRPPEDDEYEGRRYRHRWVVSGHWRQQPYGPGREQRRQQWIPAYIKGPDGAPLLATERVNVWRR